MQGSEDGLERKRAVHLLRAADPSAASFPLAKLLDLFETLDEFPIHAVEASPSDLSEPDGNLAPCLGYQKDTDIYT